METPRPSAAAAHAGRDLLLARLADDSAPRRYGVALVLALCAALLARLFHEPLGGPHYIFSLGAVGIVALLRGTGPGFLALAVCAVSGLSLVASSGAAVGAQPANALRMAACLAVGATLILATGLFRRAFSEAQRGRALYERRAERQRRARQRALERLQSLRAIASNLAEGLCALDAEGRLAFMNTAASRMLGWSEEELLGRSFHDAVHPVDAGHVPQAEADDSCPLLAVLRSGRASHGQDQVFVRKDGASFPVAYSASPIARGGRTVGVALAFQDFSAHVQAERGERFLAEVSRALTESIDWEETVARVAELAVPSLGDLCLVFVKDNGGARGVAVAASDSGRAQRLREGLHHYPIDLSAAHGVGRILRTGAPELLPEVTPESFVTEDGETAQARAGIIRQLGLRSYLGVPLVAHGRTLGAIAFGITVGARRHGEADLALAQELAARCALALDNARAYRVAQEATRSREDVIAVVSHDLRSPLAAVQLSAQLLRRMVPADAPPQLAGACDTVRSATERLARLVDDLVDFARLERGGFHVERRPHEPAGLARDALALAQPLAAERGVTIGVEVAPGLPPLSCDRHRVLQILANLIGNALKVMRGGAGAIRLSIQPDGDAVRFTVRDTGPGIPAEDLPRVFERYWRGKAAGYEGTGLGLAIAKGIVEAHGGRIWVESAPDQGAAFHFTIPADGGR